MVRSPIVHIIGVITIIIKKNNYSVKWFRIEDFNLTRKFPEVNNCNNKDPYGSCLLKLTFFPSLFDDPETRYKKLKKNASQFLISQFGEICTVEMEVICHSKICTVGKKIKIILLFSFRQD